MNEANSEKVFELSTEAKINSKDIYFMISFGVIGMLGWIVLFGLGLLIDSSVFRKDLNTHFDLINFLYSIITFTPTNILLLCILSAFEGGCASRLMVSGIQSKTDLDIKVSETSRLDSQLYMVENPFSSMVRGLVVYFLFLAGVYIATPDPFGNTSPEQYARAAGIVSVFSFIVGYDPTVFRSVLNIADKINKKQ